MNINVGSFKCPKCGNKDLFDFKNWTSIDKVENNAIKKKWIFYKEEKKECYCWGCDSGTYRKSFKFFTCYDKERRSCNSFFHLNPFFRVIGIIFGSIFYVIFILLYYILYILVLFWIGLIYYCCKKNSMHIYEPGKSEYKYSMFWSLKHEYSDNDYDLWKKQQGNTEAEYASWFKPFICEKCKYESNTFVPFLDFDIVEKKKTLDNSGITIDINQNTNENSIAINILEPFGGNEAISCKKNDLFSDVLIKFYERANKYKDEECFYLANGGIIDKDKTIEQNGLNDGDKVQLHTRGTN